MALPTTTTMRALRLHGQHDIRLESIPIPICGPNEVRIKPAVVGICGTDVHEWSRGPTLIPTSAHALTGDQAPMVLGHEVCGIVDQVGNQILDIVPGQHVVVQPIISDRTCRACVLGRPNVCRQQGFLGLSKKGGLADFMVVERRNIELLPSHVPLDIGALVEPLAVGFHAVRQSTVEINKCSALVLGAGPIGLAVIQGLVINRARYIIVSEVSESKRRLALKFGATHAFDPIYANIPAECHAIGQGEGVHVAFDCVGKQITLDQAIEATGTGGTIVNIAIWGGKATISPTVFALGEKRFIGSSVYTDEDFREVIAGISNGLIDPTDMITSRVSLANVVKEGIQGCLIEASETHVKVLVDMSL